MQRSTRPLMQLLGGKLCLRQQAPRCWDFETMLAVHIGVSEAGMLSL
jgi:hypothetical protein